MKKSFAATFFPSPETIPPPDSKQRSQTHLHEQLNWLYSDGGTFATEVKIGRWYADVQRGPLLVEIQTTAFSAIKLKLARLLPDYPIRLVTTIRGKNPGPIRPFRHAGDRSEAFPAPAQAAGGITSWFS